MSDKCPHCGSIIFIPAEREVRLLAEVDRRIDAAKFLLNKEDVFNGINRTMLDVEQRILTKVQTMLDDCQQNWKAAVEASIESAEQRIVEKVENELSVNFANTTNDITRMGTIIRRGLKREIKEEVAEAARASVHNGWACLKELAIQLEGKE